MNKKGSRIIFFILAIAFTVAVVCFVTLGQQKEPDVDQGGKGETVSKEQYPVTFFANDGTVLKVDPVEKGASANPPRQPQMLYGTVFRYWDKDLSSITEKIEVNPICEDVKGKANVFAIDGAYGKSGGTVTVPIRLCGDVCVSAFDLSISYDPNGLELASVTADGAVMYNDEVPGKIRLNYVSMENTVADVDICCLEFVVKAQPVQLPVTLEIHSIYACRDAQESNNDDLYVPEYSVMNGTVFVLPEGE